MVAKILRAHCPTVVLGTPPEGYNIMTLLSCFYQLSFFHYTYIQVRESFGRSGDVGPHATATVACFLIQEGASIVIQNKKGRLPLQSCSPDVVSLVMNFKDSLTLRKYARVFTDLFNTYSVMNLTLFNVM